ncbi:(deoxy)nucleoside triphosphate pyrophosphohydrolase [Acidipila sp. EB88]|uniref:(deoxy)nucleoside triphosphate pyrophosphohydrolase n=1 Tax=Acidipila sp. EB88 TaxID=2305226 RepID=UPI000F5FF21F|nr:(deoxy)nucleoside triphosphate pyrophosphohydrolase [Acidipila sp. EB88]
MDVGRAGSTGANGNVEDERQPPSAGQEAFAAGRPFAASGIELHAESKTEPSGGGKSVRFVVAALILRGDTVLICQRRADQPMAHKWEFPGGKMEPGETAEQALVRELHEELDIHAEIGSRVIRLRHTYRSGGAVDLQFFVVHRFQGELRNNIFQAMRWCELRNLPAYDFLAADRSLIRDLAAGKLL